VGPTELLDLAEVSKASGYLSPFRDLGWWAHKGSNLGPLPCEAMSRYGVFNRLGTGLTVLRKFLTYTLPMVS
jgi:hypothetical protein